MQARLEEIGALVDRTRAVMQGLSETSARMNAGLNESMASVKHTETEGMFHGFANRVCRPPLGPVRFPGEVVDHDGRVNLCHICGDSDFTISHPDPLRPCQAPLRYLKV